MASTSSQPGPSSGTPRGPSVATSHSQSFVDTDLVDFLFMDDFGENGGPRIRELLRDNHLMIAPLGGSHEEGERQKELKRENDSLLENLSKLSKETQKDLSEKDKLLKEMETKIKRLEERDKRVGSESQGLRWRCTKLEEDNAKLKKEMVAERAKFEKDKAGLVDKVNNSFKRSESIREECEKTMKLKLQEAENRLKESGRISKEQIDMVLKEKDELANKVARLEEHLRIQKEDLEKKLMEEQRKGQTYQENMIKRQQEVAALKDERENWVGERIRFKLFLENIGSICGYEIPTGADLLQQSEELNAVKNHVETFLEERNRDKMEVERLSGIVKHAQNLLSQAQELIRRLSGSTSNTPSAPVAVTATSNILNENSHTSPANEEPSANSQLGPNSSLKNSEADSQSQGNELYEPDSTPIAVIVGVTSIANPPLAGTPSTDLQPPTTNVDEAVSPKKRPLSTTDPEVRKKRIIFKSSDSKEIEIKHTIEVKEDSSSMPLSDPVPSIVITPAPTQPTTSSVAFTRPRAAVVATPRSETSFNNPVSTSTPLNKGPSIVVACGPAPAQTPPPINPSPRPSSESENDKDQQQQPEPKLQQSSNQRRSNGVSRLYKQFTPFAETNKAHAINRARSQHSCVCGNVYQNEKGLKVHISKMTKEWKYKCGGCLQYFFYQSELSRHLKVSVKCSSKSRNGLFSPVSSFTNYLDDLLATPTEQQQEPAAAPAVPMAEVGENITTFLNSTPTPKPAPKKPSSNKYNMRKAQQSIFRNKKHQPWSKQTVNGSWLCTCGSKFSCKNNLEMHCQYFTRDWQFRCEQCSEKYFFLSYLKKHMRIAHGIRDAFNEYSVGCHICGEMFVRRKDCYLHRKLAHDLHPRKSQRSSSIPSTSTDQRPTDSRTNDVYNISSVDEDLDDVTIVKVVRPSPSPNIPTSAPPPPSPRVFPSPTQLPPPDTAPTLPTPPVPPSTSSSSNASQTSASAQHVMVEVDPLSDENADIFKCRCGKTYLSKTALNHHIKKMTVGNIFVCLKCSRAFQVLANLKTHMRTIHQEDYRGFSCGKCKKRFVNASLFEKHRRDEHEEVTEGYDSDLDMPLD